MKHKYNLGQCFVWWGEVYRIYALSVWKDDGNAPAYTVGKPFGFDSEKSRLIGEKYLEKDPNFTLLSEEEVTFSFDVRNKIADKTSIHPVYFLTIKDVEELIEFTFKKSYDVIDDHPEGFDRSYVFELRHPKQYEEVIKENVAEWVEGDSSEVLLYYLFIDMYVRKLLPVCTIVITDFYVE